jgi:hypothetical protein
MPSHDISISIPAKPIKNVDVTIVIKSGSRKLGTLRVSKGSLDWVSGGAQKAHRIRWEDAAKLLLNHKQALRALAKAQS